MSGQNAVLEAELSTSPEAIHLYRISYAWKRGAKYFRASTVWGHRGSARDALNSFTRHNPHVLSCHVQGEEL